MHYLRHRLINPYHLSVPRRSALILYRQILESIEKNDYDNFTRRAYVPKWRKFASLPMAFAKAIVPPPLYIPK